MYPINNSFVDMRKSMTNIHLYANGDICTYSGQLFFTISVGILIIILTLSYEYVEGKRRETLP